MLRNLFISNIYVQKPGGGWKGRYRPELPKPFANRAEFSSVSTS